MRRVLAVVLPALLLAGCSEPVFVPEAGPGAPGYSAKPAPSAPDVEVVRRVKGGPLPAGGVIDGVIRKKRSFEVTGWALLEVDSPRGTLQLVLPKGMEAQVRKVQTVPRPDVASATGDDALLWSGFTVTVRGSLPEDTGVCMISRSKQGAYRLGGSDEGRCPA